DVEVERRARRPLAVLGDDLVPGAVTPVVGGVRNPVFLGGVGDERDRSLGAQAGFAEGAGQLESDGDPGRVVEGGAEPAVVVAGDDQRRPAAAAGEDADDVRSLGASGQRCPEHDFDLAVQLRRVLLADRHAGRRLLVPDPVEGAERSGRLVVGPAGWAADDHRLRAAQAELETDVVGPEARHLPLDERDLAGDVEPVELLAPAAADGDELSADSFPAGLRNAAERGALEARAVHELDERLLQAPAVDRDRLLDHVLEAELAHLARDELRRLALLGCAGDAEAERVRAERLEPLDDVAEVAGVESHSADSKPSSVSSTRGPIVSRSYPPSWTITVGNRSPPSSSPASRYPSCVTSSGLSASPAAASTPSEIT